MKPQQPPQPPPLTFEQEARLNAAMDAAGPLEWTPAYQAWYERMLANKPLLDALEPIIMAERAQRIAHEATRRQDQRAGQE